MAEDPQAPYRGPDPFLQDVPQGWAEHLSTLRPVPRSICAVLEYVPPWLRAQAWLEIFEAEAGTADRSLERVLARWWRLAVQMPTEQELRERIADIDAGRIPMAPVSESVPDRERRLAERKARSAAEKEADGSRAREPAEQQHAEEDAASQRYLACLEKLLAQERAYRKTLVAAQEADRQRRASDAAAPGHDAPSPPYEPPL